jgi:hypothetical protein
MTRRKILDHWTEVHRDLAKRLSAFKLARIVCRFYEHPLVSELYPEGERWRYVRLDGRAQTNGN